MSEVISQALMDRYRKVGVPTIYSGVKDKGFTQCYMKGVTNFSPGQRLVGRARTVRYLPWRPDIAEDTDRGEDSPEYRAMGSCGPGDVLVAGVSGRKWDAIGGDMVLLHLKMVEAEGVITDGGIRDVGEVLSYGYKVFAGGRTPAGRGPAIMSYEDGTVIECGGITIRPGDLMVADDDGIVCVPQQYAEEIIRWAEEHEEFEQEIKSMILKENVPPGKYYNAAMFERLHENRKR